jgi:hypothetical protein
MILSFVTLIIVVYDVYCVIFRDLNDNIILSSG